MSIPPRSQGLRLSSLWVFPNVFLRDLVAWDTLFNRTLHNMPINPQLFVLH